MSTFNSLVRFAPSLPSILALAAAVSPSAHAAPMTRQEFLALVGGEYESTLPSPALLTHGLGFNPGVRIYEREDRILLQNRLAIGTKVNVATYEVTGFECYTHAPESTSCHFRLNLLDQGGNVHFMGVTPFVEVNRRADVLTLHVSPRYGIAGQMRVPSIILERI